MCLLANAVCHKWNVIVWPWHDGKLRQTFFLFGTDSLTEMNSCQLMFGHCHRAHVALLNIQTMIYFFVGTGGFPFPHCDILGKRNGNFSVNDLHVEGQKKKKINVNDRRRCCAIKFVFHPSKSLEWNINQVWDVSAMQLAVEIRFLIQTLNVICENFTLIVRVWKDELHS